MNKRIRNNLILMCVLVLLILVSCAALVCYVDPFFHYHAPLEGFEYVIDNQLTQNPGMAEHMNYDSVILGSSMTVNFETDWFKELMGLNTLKLSYSSAYPKDISNILEKIYGHSAEQVSKQFNEDGRYDNPIFDNSREIRKVFLGIDIVTYSGGINETKYPIPKYLYDKNLINDIRYLFNKEVLLSYVIRPIVAPEPMNLSHIYASWWTDEYYNEEWVLRNHDAILEPNPSIMDSHGFDADIMKNLDANIIPYIEAHPETEFVLFFPPYSILFWNDAIMDGHLEASLNAYKCICDALNGYDNVKMYFFPSKADTVTDLNNYADYTHYHPSVNRFMAEAFINDTCVINKEGIDGPGKSIDEYITDMRNMIEAYDFDILRAKIVEYQK